jgi:hypothetical protein
MTYATSDDKTEIEEFQLEPLNTTYAMLLDTIKGFYQKVDPAIAQSNHEPTRVQELMEDGYEQRYMSLVKDGKIYGLVCFNYERGFVAGHRCYIRHFSTISMAHYKNGLKSVVDYIWREVLCDDIRAEIIHIQNEDGTKKADADIKQTFKELGFRWKTLTNNPSTGT